MQDFDEAYAASPHLFGVDPEPLVTRFLERMDRGRAILDLGAGQGRNAIALAEAGFEVHAVDPSRPALDQLKAQADRRGLRVLTRDAGYADFEAPASDYGTILAIGLVPLLPRVELGSFVERVRSWLGPAGLVFVTAFSTMDPQLQQCARDWTLIGRHSFRGPTGETRTFLEAGEVLDLFAGLRAIHHWEGMGPEHRHGEGPLHRHGMVEAVLQR